jgi:large subunit ribosomal protein L25
MSNQFTIDAEVRAEQGKGASRRLRREGKVPAILYGGHKEPLMLAVRSLEIEHKLRNEAFYSHILTLNIAGKEESAVLKDLQRHPARSVVTHMDLQRVLADEEIRMHVPLHFKGEEIAPGVKQDAGVIQHHLVDVEVLCLPKHLPEFIEVDVSALGLNETIHLSQLTPGEGVTLVALQHGDDQSVVSVTIPKVVEEEAPAEAAPAEVPTVGEEAKAAAETEGDEKGDEKGGKKDDKSAKKEEKGGK